MISLIPKLVSVGFLVALASPASAYFAQESGPIEFYVGNSTKSPQTIEFDKDDKDVFKVYLQYPGQPAETVFNRSNYVHLYKQPGTSKMEVPGPENDAQLLGKIGYAYHFGGEYKTNISFIVKGPRADLDRTCGMSIYFKPHARGVLNAVTKPFIHLWSKEGEEVCKVEHIEGEYVIEPAKTITVPKLNGRGYHQQKVPAKMGVKNNFVITILPIDQNKLTMKPMPLTEDDSCFKVANAAVGFGFGDGKETVGKEGGYNVVSAKTEKTICPNQSLTITLPDVPGGYSYNEMQLNLIRPIKLANKDVSYTLDLGNELGGEGKIKFAADPKHAQQQICVFNQPEDKHINAECLAAKIGDRDKNETINTRAKPATENTVMIKNNGNDPFFVSLKAWSKMPLPKR